MMGFCFSVTLWIITVSLSDQLLTKDSSLEGINNVSAGFLSSADYPKKKKTVPIIASSASILFALNAG